MREPHRPHSYVLRPLADVSAGQLRGHGLQVRLQGFSRAAPEDRGEDQEAGGGGRLLQHWPDELQKHLGADERPDQLRGPGTLEKTHVCCLPPETALGCAQNAGETERPWLPQNVPEKADAIRLPAASLAGGAALWRVPNSGPMHAGPRPWSPALRRGSERRRVTSGDLRASRCANANPHGHALRLPLHTTLQMA